MINQLQILRNLILLLIVLLSYQIVKKFRQNERFSETFIILNISPHMFEVSTVFRYFVVRVFENLGIFLLGILPYNSLTDQ
jgi:hypothetical protein